MLAVVLLLASWAALHEGFYARDQIIDTPVYENYGEAMTRGEVPYRDFELEYPPAALPVFLVPALGRSGTDTDSFRRLFEALMLVCGAIALGAMAGALGALGAAPRRVLGALGFAALAPLAVGSVLLSRFDLWPAALTAAALAAFVSARERIGFGLLGLAVAAKLFPGVLLPLALAQVWRSRGRREAVVGVGIFAAALGACFLPFLVLGPGGVVESISRQLSRPLQIESLGSAVLLAAHHLFDVGLTLRDGSGSQNLVGAAPDAIALVQSLVQVVALAALWVAFARRRGGPERFVRYSAAAVVAFIALGKVLSPQFLIWLVPLVPLVRGARGVAASALLGVAMVLTQLWFPSRYWELVAFDALPSWLLLARDLTLLALLALLLWPARTRGQVLQSSNAASMQDPTSH